MNDGKQFFLPISAVVDKVVEFLSEMAFHLYVSDLCVI